jgi:hypothetical protein
VEGDTSTSDLVVALEAIDRTQPAWLDGILIRLFRRLPDSFEGKTPSTYRSTALVDRKRGFGSGTISLPRLFLSCSSRSSALASSTRRSIASLLPTIIPNFQVQQRH